VCGNAIAGQVEDGFTAFMMGDYSTALRLWRSLADRGNAEAQNYSGVAYGRCNFERISSASVTVTEALAIGGQHLQKSGMTGHDERDLTETCGVFAGGLVIRYSTVFLRGWLQHLCSRAAIRNVIAVR
jgi:hypothetical protein